MSLFLKLFNTTAEYNAYTADTANFILPNVSCAMDNLTTVYYNPYVHETKLVVYYDIQDISSPTTVCTNYDGSFKSMEIDGVDSVDITTQGNITYQFDGVGEHVIKYELNGLGVGTSAPLFYNLSTVKRVIIPNTFTSIGENAFNSCSGLTSCTIGSGVTSIGGTAFYNCSGLTSFSIPNSVTSIGNQAFVYCSGLTSIDIPSSVASIGNDAFNSCSGLTTCTIGSGVTSIGNQAFYQCSGLTSITVETTTPPTLGSYAFSNTNNCPIYVPCESVNSYKSASGWSIYASRIYGIPPCGEENMKFRAEYSDSSTYSAACDSSSELTTATTRAHSTSYTAMTNAIVGNCVTSIGNYAFENCSGITSCTFAEGSQLSSIGQYAFRNCSGLTSIDIPNSVTSIGEAAFSQCSGLTSISIPNSVTTIGNGAFYSCSGLTTCTIGSGVTSIGMNAFQYCSSLIGIVSNAVTPPTLIYNAQTPAGYIYMNFDDTNECPIYVPSASVETYKSANGWSKYASRIQAIP